MLALLLLIFIIIAALEVPDLVRQRHYRSLMVFIVFYMLGVYLSLVQYCGCLPYNPFTIILSKLSYLPLNPMAVLMGWYCG